MKPITEEQRQALIAHGVQLKEQISENNYLKEFGERTVSLIEIALASLTADVFMHGISDPDGNPYFSECCVDDDGSGVSDEVCALNDGETDCIGGYRVTPLYTAPPVPVIKLPDEKDVHPLYECAYQQGWNKCLAEIKRLNGIS